MWIWFCRRTLPYENLYGAVVFDDDVCNFYFFRLLWKKQRERERERERGYMIYREKRGVFSRVSVGQFKRRSS